ncbi:MAG: hypothetical protein LDL33_10120, partial [Desulfomonile sp.]|nr:hypothetical protein [Desulfomonile sp.]
MKFTVQAPNRIDLAGGTTDLYPLYLLMDGGCTVNAAVSVLSTVTFTRSDVPGVKIVSQDLGTSIEANEPSRLPRTGPLALVCRTVAAMWPPGPAKISTRNHAPSGSGLGASSALIVAVISGLLKFRG